MVALAKQVGFALAEIRIILPFGALAVTLMMAMYALCTARAG
jgi:hypothetical protein